MLTFDTQNKKNIMATSTTQRNIGIYPSPNPQGDGKDGCGKMIE